MEKKDFVIRVLKHAYRKISGKRFEGPECDCDRQSSNDKIYELLSSGEACMISRYGTTEINCVNNYICVYKKRNSLLKYCDYITDCTHTPWWNTSIFRDMYVNSGIFPPCQETAERFSERYLIDSEEIDLLGTHQYYEKFMPLRKNVIRVQLEMLYPFFVERPWTRYLKGKKVLVVHPFEDTIHLQYSKRKLLFENEEILPDFHLETLKAVQTAGGNKSDFKDWFDALKYMENEISKRNFDICLIGCGAYGLPLAAFVKRMGKQAIHLGGGLQLLFGILGNRWTRDYPQKKFWIYRDKKISLDYTPLFNDNWIYPLESDTIANAQSIEGACYWK